VTIVVLLAVVAFLSGLLLVSGARRRAQRRAAEAMLAKARAIRRSRVPDVSSNLKGVTATQVIEPVGMNDSGDPRDKRAA
jgi:hypothetical protein